MYSVCVSCRYLGRLCSRIASNQPLIVSIVLAVCFCKLSHWNLSWAAIGLESTRQILILLYLPIANVCNISVFEDGRKWLFHMCLMLQGGRLWKCCDANNYQLQLLEQQFAYQTFLRKNSKYSIYVRKFFLVQNQRICQNKGSWYKFL